MTDTVDPQNDAVVQKRPILGGFIDLRKEDKQANPPTPLEEEKERGIPTAISSEPATHGNVFPESLIKGDLHVPEDPDLAKLRRDRVVERAKETIAADRDLKERRDREQTTRQQLHEGTLLQEQSRTGFPKRTGPAQVEWIDPDKEQEGTLYVPSGIRPDVQTYKRADSAEVQRIKRGQHRQRFKEWNLFSAMIYLRAYAHAKNRWGWAAYDEIKNDLSPIHAYGLRKFYEAVAGDKPLYYRRLDHKSDKKARLAARKSGTTVANTTQTGWASELVRTELLGFIDTLPANSLFAAMRNAGAEMLDFEDRQAIVMFRRAPRPLESMSAAFVGTDASIPVKQDRFGSTTLARYKMGVISVVSEELVQTSQPNIIQLLNDSFLTDTSDAIDRKLLSDDPLLAGTSPAGLWRNALSQSSSGTTLEHILQDLLWATRSLATLTQIRQPLMIMHPSRLVGLRLVRNAMGEVAFPSVKGPEPTIDVFRIVESTNVPENEVFICEPNDVAFGFFEEEFEVSVRNETALVMANADGTPPSMSLNDPSLQDSSDHVNETTSIHIEHPQDRNSAARTSGGPVPVLSTFQTNNIAVRFMLPVTWGTLRDEGFLKLTNVQW